MSLKSPLLTTLAAALTFSSCATVKYSQKYSEPGFQLGNLATAKSAVYHGQTVMLDDYKKTYASEYGSADALLGGMKQTFIADLEKKLPGIQLRTGDNPNTSPLLGGASFKEEEIAQAQEFFKSHQDDYIILLKEVTLGEEIRQQASAAPAPAPGGAPGASGVPQSSAVCMVTLQVEIWDVKEMKKVYAYQVRDESTVSLFMYATALHKAVDKTAANASRYIVGNGEIKGALAVK